MKCSWFLRLSVIPFLSISLYAQSSMTAKASGACNTAIAGGSGNKITISCTGISGAEAAKLTSLMNRILNQHLDLKEVNSKLDQLTGEMNSLNSALNPMAGAPKPLKELDDEGARLLITCNALIQRWSTSTPQQSVLDYSSTQAPGYADSAQLFALRDARLKAFHTTLAPRIDSLFERYRQAGMDETSFPDYRSIQSPDDLRDFYFKFGRLHTPYFEANRSLNREVYQEYSRLRDDCLDFYWSWTKSAQAETLKAHDEALKAQDKALKAHDASQAKLYRKTLMPELIAWRAKVLRYSPSSIDDMDYEASTFLQLASVCGNVSQLRSAFQTEVSQSLRRK